MRLVGHARENADNSVYDVWPNEDSLLTATLACSDINNRTLIMYLNRR